MCGEGREEAQVVKEISDNDEISIISPSKYKSSLSSSPVSQSEACREALDNYGK